MDGVEKDAVMAALQEIVNSSELIKGIKRVTITYNPDQRRFVILMFWDSHDQMIEKRVMFHKSPEFSKLFSLIDGNTYEVEDFELVSDKDY